ncbi:hypothetical protein RF55_6308 [Lasius niger]|uniref:Uncharacterized protein n=1 Tax=Lasius niger TaxID=67767 RepID=A0A0J7KTF0_LASNI|nr:hypothetical protein RF55_6308 [Lasius niger]
MLRAKQKIKRIARMDIEKFVKDVKDVQNNSKINKSKKKNIILTDESSEEEISKPENPEKTAKKNSLDSDKEGGQRLRRKRSLVSEKGMRHISRLMRLISGKQPLDNVVGLVENQQMKILFDHRGEFNVMTEAAIKQIESKIGKLERLKNSASIPTYLKKEKKIKVRAVRLNIIIANREINIEAMILNKEEKICVLFARHACKEMGRKLSKLPKGNSELTRWDIHLTEQDRKKMLKQREKEEEEQKAVKRKSTKSYIVYSKRAKISVCENIPNNPSDEDVVITAEDRRKRPEAEEKDESRRINGTTGEDSDKA